MMSKAKAKMEMDPNEVYLFSIFSNLLNIVTLSIQLYGFIGASLQVLGPQIFFFFASVDLLSLPPFLSVCVSLSVFIYRQMMIDDR